MSFQYFAYGSNMLTARLRAVSRCPSAKIVCVAEASGYELEFSKRSQDKSGKATLVSAIGQRTTGVVFEIAENELAALDKAEGAGNGYTRVDNFAVQRPEDGAFINTVTYLASKTEPTLKPFDWYLALVIAGAREHSLTEDHVAILLQTQYLNDNNLERETRMEAIDALTQSSHTDWEQLLHK